jgi:hypothetical protein
MKGGKCSVEPQPMESETESRSLRGWITFSRRLNEWVVQNNEKCTWKLASSDRCTEEKIVDSRQIRSENRNNMDKSEDEGGFGSSRLRLCQNFRLHEMQKSHEIYSLHK